MGNVSVLEPKAAEPTAKNRNKRADWQVALATKVDHDQDDYIAFGLQKESVWWFLKKTGLYRKTFIDLSHYSSTTMIAVVDCGFVRLTWQYPTAKYLRKIFSEQHNASVHFILGTIHESNFW